MDFLLGLEFNSAEENFADAYCSMTKETLGGLKATIIPKPVMLIGLGISSAE